MAGDVPSDLQSAAVERLKAALGERGWSDDPERLAGKLVESRGRWRGSTPLLVSPQSVEETARIVRICAEAGLSITPQGGNTGLVGGQIPQGEILLSTERMARVREIDLADDVMIVEAGAILANVHEAASRAGRRFPLDLASSGSATIGGLVSTNAGGVEVLRYGTMRSLVLGLEAVLPSGEVFAGLKRLRKDNTGYDVKQLLIGAEGTLGVVTAAALRLFPALAERAVAIAALASPREAVKLLELAKKEAGEGVEAFELIGALGMALVLDHLPGARAPFAEKSPWYVLIETASVELGLAGPALERILAAALDMGLIADAAIAKTEADAKAFWALREGQSEAQRSQGPVWKHDISVPVSKVAEFIERAGKGLGAAFPGVRIDAFGHVGDGNIHYDVLCPDGGDPARHAARREAGAHLVHQLAVSLGGSISAEHGLGVMKTAEALAFKDPVDVALQRALRATIDPRRTFNPRVLF
ncbi:MAG: FAD-binding oxidoreductase [Caulobacteraceae bacterium]